MNDYSFAEEADGLDGRSVLTDLFVIVISKNTQAISCLGHLCLVKLKRQSLL